MDRVCTLMGGGWEIPGNVFVCRVVKLKGVLQNTIVRMWRLIRLGLRRVVGCCEHCTEHSNFRIGVSSLNRLRNMYS